MTNALYYGDNLHVLRDEIASDSVDLVFLDPPFNSQANYNLLFKGPSGKGADAQIEAFEDTWHWGEQAERAFSEVLASPYTQAAELFARCARASRASTPRRPPRRRPRAHRHARPTAVTCPVPF